MISSTEAEFERRVAQGEFLEYARVFGRHWYGTPRKWVDEARRLGMDLVLEIDVQGARQVKAKSARGRRRFHRATLAPGRRTEAARSRAGFRQAIARRLERARQEMDCWSDYDFVVVNDDLERASDELRSIVVACRCRRQDNDERFRKILDTFGGT